jgi:hypothetical protein
VRSLIYFIFNEYDKIKSFKKSGILSVGLSNISVVSGILSVVRIPPVPIPEQIQLLMYGYKEISSLLISLLFTNLIEIK